MSKVSVIGAGHVGEIVAFGLVRSEAVDELVLVDIIEATPIIGADVKVYGTNDYSDIAGSDIVVVPAGSPRKPGMSRMDLLNINAKICKSIVEQIKEYAPDSKIIYVANPVDVLTYAAWKLSGFETNRVFGMAGILDTARYRAFIAMEAKVSVKDILAMVLGGHGDAMLPLVRYTTIGGIPVTHFLSDEQLEKIVERTRKGGGEIVSLLKTGSAYYAPGLAVAEMVEAVLRDQRRVLPVVAYLDNKYGMSDVYAGAPVILGKNGVEEVLEIDLTADELAAYQKSVEHVKEGVNQIMDILNNM